MDNAVQCRVLQGSTVIRIVTWSRNDVAALTMIVRIEMKTSSTALPLPCQPNLISTCSEQWNMEWHRTWPRISEHYTVQPSPWQTPRPAACRCAPTELITSLHWRSGDNFLKQRESWWPCLHNWWLQLQLKCTFWKSDRMAANVNWISSGCTLTTDSCGCSWSVLSVL